MTFRIKKYLPVYENHSHGHFKCNELKQMAHDRVESTASIKTLQMCIKEAVQYSCSWSTSV